MSANGTTNLDPFLTMLDRMAAATIISTCGSVCDGIEASIFCDDLENDKSYFGFIARPLQAGLWSMGKNDAFSIIDCSAALHGIQRAQHMAKAIARHPLISTVSLI